MCREANQAGTVEEQVRAPLPSKVERLYGDYDMAPRPGQGRGRLPIPANVVDAFRDFGLVSSHLTILQAFWLKFPCFLLPFGVENGAKRTFFMAKIKMMTLLGSI